MWSRISEATKPSNSIVWRVSGSEDVPGEQFRGLLDILGPRSEFPLLIIGPFIRIIQRPLPASCVGRGGAYGVDLWAGKGAWAERGVFPRPLP